MSTKINQAFEAWNKTAKTKIHDQETFEKLLSLSPRMRQWYKDWSIEYSAFSQMPQSFKDAGITPAEWKAIEKKLPKINEIRSKASKEVEEKAKEFSQFVKKKDEDVKEQLESLEDDLVKILKVNISCLPLEEQVTILGTPEDRRSEVEQTFLEALRTKLLKDRAENNFTDPFVFGDYKDLLI